MSARIMIVDDEPGIVDVVQRYFALSGYEVIAAQSGEEALKKISCRPDLILLDINMPGLNGLEVCARIRAHVSCPILFLTARIERSDKIVGFQAGGDDYIVKPFVYSGIIRRAAASRREKRPSRIPRLNWLMLPWDWNCSAAYSPANPIAAAPDNAASNGEATARKAATTAPCIHPVPVTRAIRGSPFSTPKAQTPSVMRSVFPDRSTTV